MSLLESVKIEYINQTAQPIIDKYVSDRMNGRTLMSDDQQKRPRKNTSSVNFFYFNDKLKI